MPDVRGLGRSRVSAGLPRAPETYSGKCSPHILETLCITSYIRWQYKLQSQLKLTKTLSFLQISSGIFRPTEYPVEGFRNLANLIELPSRTRASQDDLSLQLCAIQTEDTDLIQNIRRAYEARGPE